VDLRRWGRNVLINKLASSLELRQCAYQRAVYLLRAVQEYAVIDTFSMMTAFVCWCYEHHTVQQLYASLGDRGSCISQMYFYVLFS